MKSVFVSFVLVQVISLPNGSSKCCMVKTDQPICLYAKLLFFSSCLFKCSDADVRKMSCSGNEGGVLGVPVLKDGGIKHSASAKAHSGMKQSGRLLEGQM